MDNLKVGNLVKIVGYTEEGFVPLHHDKEGRKSDVLWIKSSYEPPEALAIGMIVEVETTCQAFGVRKIYKILFKSTIRWVDKIYLEKL